MRPLLLFSIVALLWATGCDSGKPAGSASSSAPDLSPVADNSPYLCDLVPEAGLRKVTGLNIRLDARWDGPQTNSGLCLARAQGREAPLGIDWSYSNGDHILRTQRRAWANQSTHSIPDELGSGLAGVAQTAGGTARPNFVIALFKCGGKKPWISIDFAPVVRGRDAVQDMVAFMRIAQKRFGQLHKCTPEGKP